MNSLATKSLSPCSLVLIGAPGSGKSTIGRILAKSLNLPFVDTDELVEVQAGESISNIFVNQGESHFRALERECVQLALEESVRNPAIISLGGGSILNVDTQRDLSNYPVAWLRVKISEALKRVGMNQARPLLLGNVRSNLISLLQERTPIYEKLSDIILDTSEISPEKCAEQLAVLMKQSGVDHDRSH